MSVRDSVTTKMVASQDQCVRSELGSRLRKVRKKCGLSQKKMAVMLGIATSTYQYYERGERDTPAYIFCKLVTIFKVSPRWLLTGEGEMFTEEKTVSPEDAPMVAMTAYIKDVWLRSDPRERIWLEIQFSKCFPDFVEWRKMREEEGEKKVMEVKED